MRLKIKGRSHIYDINRPQPRNGHKYTKYKMCVSIVMAICVKATTKQHLKFSL